VSSDTVVAEIKALRAAGDESAALDHALGALEHDRGNGEIVALTCGLLDTWERFDESLRLVEGATGLDPLTAKSLRAATFEAMNRLDDSLALRREVHLHDPTVRRNHFDYARMLIRAASFDQADAEIEAFATAHPRGKHWKLRILWLNAQQRRVEGLELAESVFADDPGKLDGVRTLMRQLQKCIQKDRSEVARSRAAELLDQIGPDVRSDSNALGLAVLLAIALGRDAQARDLLQSAPADANDAGFLRGQAWASHMDGDVDAARAIWDEIRLKQSVPATRPCQPDELVRADAHSPDASRAEIRLFTVIRNELWRLPWFVDHYRALGVERFFFVDNDSTDGSREWLLTQPDVYVFHTTTPYALGRSGMVWVNDLVARYGRHGWNLYVDVDEALVFDDVEHHDLRDLTTYMERKGHDMAAGQMVDMFAMGDVTLPSDGFESDFIGNYPFFDRSYERTPTAQCPYFFTSGGIRRLAHTGENQTKTPLIRGGRNIQFLSSSHIVTPGVVSDVSVALLHFKLAGDYRKEFHDDGSSNDRVGECKLRYLAYAEFFESWAGTEDAVGVDTIRYSSSRSLVDAGLLTPLVDGFV